MPEKIVRVVFTIACGVMGGLWARYFIEQLNEAGNQIPMMPWIGVGAAVGILTGVVVLVAVHLISQEMYERLAPAVVAVVIALLVGYAVSRYMLFWFPHTEPTLQIFISVTIVLIFGYIGIYVALNRAARWESLMSAVKRTSAVPASAGGSIKLVDTSVLIDGRIADICASGFVEGVLMVPRFVLKELQHIADSADVLRRAKGRRGLDILKKIQDLESKVSVVICEDDPDNVREVDAKLVELAKRFKAKILTLDFNLNKVAQIDGVEVLNINELANALKPAVLPDEVMEVKIIKEGKESNQGVGYLDDGTMIVVDGGRVHMGKTVQAVVTSVLQTSAGKMIFTRFIGVIQ
ncbi:MAG TPA: TRAM domain-containing protein [Candidatus Hydrogenedentes bacterium]|nr:TRAM domain-containing protein [Candidatus Hydrogenedentota bacterium]